MSFMLSQRVVVSPHYHWAQGETGTIAPHIDGSGSACRSVNTNAGPIDFYWVVFDVAQLDADGDGPYQGAEIDERHLSLVREDN